MATEFDRIDRWFRPLCADHAGALNLTDDGAIVSIESGLEVVVTSDAMVESVHFLPQDPPQDIGYKLLAVNLSDLAAMGADPLGYTLNIIVSSERIGESWFEEFSHGLGQAQERYGVTLLGGDSVGSDGPVTLSITAMGVVPRGQALTRRASSRSDQIFVTGTLGDAAIGLAIAQGQFSDLDPNDRAYVLKRLRRPVPRVNVGSRLRRIASAAIDISDGLVADLGHICGLSECGAIVRSDLLPLSSVVRGLVHIDPDLLPRLITHGDDYELLFTASESMRSQIARIAAETDCSITEIGSLQPEPTVTVLDRNALPLSFKQHGWIHSFK